MKEYLFYIEGLYQEVWIKGDSQKEAFTSLWNSLTCEEKDLVNQMECIDVRGDE